MFPQPLECRFDVRREVTAHPALVDAVRAGNAVTRGERLFELRLEVAIRFHLEWSLSRSQQRRIG